MSQLPGQAPGPEEREQPPAPPTYHPPPPPGYLPASQPPVYPLPPPPVAQQQQPGRRGVIGWLTAFGLFILGYAKYAFLLIKAVPALATVSTMLLSYGIYAAFAGPAFAAAIVSMILVHELGHVVEIRRQGLQATAPVFIPFVGAAIFQRAHPQDALRQAQIGIAGPLAGTAGAVVAYLLYGTTGWSVFALAASIGFLINLINLIPAGMLDGGWILAPVSKWFQVIGIALMAVLVFFFGLSPILFVVVLFSIPTIIARFRYADSPYFRNVPAAGRWGIGAAWLVLVLFLGFALVASNNQLQPVIDQIRR